MRTREHSSIVQFVNKKQFKRVGERKVNKLVSLKKFFLASLLVHFCIKGFDALVTKVKNNSSPEPLKRLIYSVACVKFHQYLKCR